ncbi:serine protease family protein [Chitinophaga tropicalis]|uniref:Trypsin-like peptidase n=1 Tax=Chitinophaga tropicalis TaxID=2683588 RepID=A0A7K1UAA4_9BACT|nr:hypothetical protein [Chitinophaga tropicalis]MVT11228.1 hypothetical protein [Chitinophaga tropicalis]
MQTLIVNDNIYTSRNNIGSIGGFYQFRGDPEKRVFGLTNYHVAQIDGICTAGQKAFGINSNEGIGTLFSWFRLESDIVNSFDLALVNLDKTLVRPLWGLDTAGYAVPAIDQEVRLMNRREIRTGFISNVNSGEFSVTIAGTDYRIGNLIQITSANDLPFSEHGHSGSVIFSDTNQLVGVLVGGDPENRHLSYVMPFLDRRNRKGILNSWALEVADL